MKYEWSDLPPQDQLRYMSSYKRILERLVLSGYIVKEPVSFQESQVIHPWMWEAAEVIMNSSRRKITENRKRRLERQL